MRHRFGIFKNQIKLIKRKDTKNRKIIEKNIEAFLSRFLLIIILNFLYDERVSEVISNIIAVKAKKMVISLSPRGKNINYYSLLHEEFEI